ncbi:uncharacterized protein V6R79_020864 [Siganus canaliculatus]
MNSSRYLGLTDTVSKNVITVSLAFTINCINGAFVYTYFRNQVFQRDPRYVLYIHLVINDMMMLTISVVLQILSYTPPMGAVQCVILLLIGVTTNRNSPLNLAAMALERYIAVCRPLHHAQICTAQRAYVLIALIWLVSFIPAISDVIIVLITQPASVFSRRILCHALFVFTTPHNQKNHIVTEVLLFSFVFLTVTATYLKVLCAARAASGSNQASARNARNTILLHGVQVLLCMLSIVSPFLMIRLITVWPDKSYIILFVTFQFTNVLPRLLSPLIYGVRDRKFRSQMKLHFCTNCCISVDKKVNLRGSKRRSKQWLS